MEKKLEQLINAATITLKVASLAILLYIMQGVVAIFAVIKMMFGF